MKRVTIFLFVAFSSLAITAQTEGISINNNGQDPDSSAILDVQSTSKGMLTPRMTSNDRNAINDPANGLIVYDLDTQSFWYFDNGVWNEIRNGNEQLSYQDLLDSTLVCDQQVSNFGPYNNPRRIAFGGHFAYVLSGGFQNRFDIIDICDPLSPSKKGGLVLSSSIIGIASIAVLGNYVYIGAVSGSTNNLSIYDVSDPLNPSFHSFVPAADPFNFNDMKIRGNLLVGAGGDGLAVLNISDPANPVLLSSPQFSTGTLEELELRGDYAYCTHTSDRIEVFDISDPANPSNISSTPIGGDPEDMVLIGSYLYISDRDNDILRLFDIANPYNPLADSMLLPASDLRNLTVVGNKLFVRMNANNNQIGIIDVSKAGNPVFENTISLSGTASSGKFETYGDFAYFCDWSADEVKVIKACIPKSLNLDPATGEFIIGDIDQDNQNLSLTGLQLNIEDGEGVDLSPLFENVSNLTDDDQDTKIEVETNPDEDIIRIVAGGVESLSINNEGIYSTGPADASSVPLIEGPGRRLMWLPGLSVFRVGEAVGTEWDNANLANNSSVLGGENNAITNSGQFSTIGGGKNNSMLESFSFLGAGTSNTVSGSFAFIGAGNKNTASKDFSVISGGKNNQTNREFATVSGGESNIANGRHSFIGGGRNNTTHSFGETVLGIYATNYTPVSDSFFHNSDRLFVVGNGYNDANRSNALTILKNGNTGFGTTLPDKKLHLVGQFKYEDGNQTEGAIITSDPNGVASWNDGLILKNGNIGLGTALPDKKLHLVGQLKYEDGNQTEGAILTSDPDGVADWNDDMVLKNGNIGIGTSNPGYKLEVNGTARITSSLRTSGILFPGAFGPDGAYVGNGGNYLAFGHSGVSEDFIGYKSNTFYFKDSPGGGDASDPNVIIGGKVGIGTTNLSKAKVHISGAVSSTINEYGWLDHKGGINSVTGKVNSTGNSGSFSLWASDRIAADQFNAFSDIRIKNVQGVSNSVVDLSTLMQIEITDYTLRDTIAKGKTPTKKVIAQQIAEVYPQAVTNNLTEVVPDIYQRAEVKDGWVMLVTDLTVGERVKIISEEKAEVYEVIEVGLDRFKINLPLTTANGQTQAAFIYGREVNDFHTVDYEAISMLNVSATQEQQKLIEAQQAEIERLKALNHQLISQQNSQEDRQKNLEARLKALEMVLSNQAN